MSLKRDLRNLALSGGLGFTLFILFFVAVLAGAGLCWDYTVSYWLTYFDKPDNFRLFHGMLIALLPVLGQLSLPLAGITFILSMFLGG